MNQKVVVYIILSAILLYLYYKRGDIAIFAAFVVVVAGALFAGAREGMTLGGGGKGDKECAKMGFIAPKIDKKDIKGSLEKVMKNIEKVSGNYLKFEGELVAKNKEVDKNIKMIIGSDPMKGGNLTKDERDHYISFLFGSYEVVNAYIINPSDENKSKTVKNMTQNNISNAIKGGNLLLSMLNQFVKSDEMKNVDKKTADFIVCLIKHAITIWNNVDKASGGKDGDAVDDDAGGDEKKKKKNTKATKKKKSKKDDEDEGAADEDDE